MTTAPVFFKHASAELATLTNTFSVAGVATDPTTVSLTVTTPSGTSNTYTYAAAQITKSGTGVYTKDIACTEAGQWVYAWVGTGTASDVVAGTWTVFDTTLNRRYCSVEEVKDRLRITDAVDDQKINTAIEAASRAIDQHCNRRFWPGTDTRTYEARDWYCVEVDDLVSVTTLATDSGADGTYETIWSSGTDYRLTPVNPGAFPETHPYIAIEAIGSKTFPIAYSNLPIRKDLVQVAGVFGWPEVPAMVKEACLVLVADYRAVGQAPFGVAGFGDFAVRIRSNSRAEALLSPYRRDLVLV